MLFQQKSATLLRTVFLAGGMLMASSMTLLDTARAESALSPVDQGWVARVQDTMNAVTTMKGRFEQVAPDGQRTTGTVWLARPGRMRFEYDKPSPLLLVANDGKVVFRDTQLDQTTEIPLERTPLGLLLSEHVSLTGDVTVTDFRRQAGTLQISAVRTAAPGEGTLVMLLSEQPLSLQGWTVIDAQGRQTRVVLSDVKQGVRVSDTLFALPREN
ncbi:LolA family protein [Acetobacter sp.]|jgi:outer membrane lipoprotein-sorting protein|uniref:LolA family protein n=1 Tax=Acetobacter sp. TaxID=440 RepID=UPI0025C3A8E5|nr:outer membrane lipoprotein carrier protein LolA [Acetobacter sp.]MCI1298860.1 outer membrane lipoprotein carrier protein LolA [Acetobacter sp.]